MQGIQHRFCDNISNFKNNSLLVRLILAFAVFYSHMFAIYGLPEPTLLWGAHSLGWYAVNMFFLLSGVLVSQSFEYRSVKSYAWARFLRIYPAYVVGLVVSLVAALIFSQVELSWHALKFVWSNMLPLRELSLGLSGAWLTSAQPSAMNNSLWTIPFEIFCYIFIVPLLLFEKSKRPAVWVVVIFVVAMLFILSRLNIFSSSGDIRYDLLRVIFYYGLGVSFYQWVKGNKVVWQALFFLSGVGICEQSLGEATLELIIVPLCLFIAFYMKTLSSLKSDFSYGVYVYAWPISQIVFAYGVRDIYFGISMAFILLLGLSYLSWNYLEKPCLKFKGKG